MLLSPMSPPPGRSSLSRGLLRFASWPFLVLGFAAAVASAQPAEAKASAHLEQLWRSGAAPGISSAVMVQGRLAFSRGLGYADLDNMVPTTASTVYNIGSVSKAVSAVAIMQLVEQRKVGLDDPIQKYVPTFPDKGSPITIRHIMTHTSGIRHYRPADFADSGGPENTKPVSSLEEGIRIFKDDRLLFPPGEYYSYSSYATNLLQGVVETASGGGFEDYLRRYVWIPAGMVTTSFDVPERIVPHRAKGYRIDGRRVLNYPYGDVSYKFAGGGMISTAEDLVRFGVALNRHALLSADTTALMYRPVAPVMQYQANGPPLKLDWVQGLVWRIFTDEEGRTFVNHCGTVKGFNACLVNYPEENVVAAIMWNGGSVPAARKETVTLAHHFLPPRGSGRP